MFSAIIKGRSERKDKRYDASVIRYDIKRDISLYLHIFDIYNNMFFVSFRDIYIVIKKQIFIKTIESIKKNVRYLYNGIS